MARLRMRRNPVRARSVGALLINPRPKFKFKASRLFKRARRRNPPVSRSFASAFPVRVSASSGRPQRAYRRRAAGSRGKSRIAAFNYRAGRPVMSLASFRKSRKAHKRTRRARKNPIFLAKRNPSRRRRHARRNPIFLAKRNPSRRRRARRNPGFGALLLKRNPLFVARSNPKRRKAHRKAHSKHRRNPSRRRMARRNPSGMLGKIPVIGPILASASAFLMPAAFGAVSVEPVLAVTQFVAPYLPAWMPYSATVAAGGVLLGAVVKRYGPFSAATNEKLAVACAAGSGAVAYYEWRNGAGAAPVGAKAGADILAGYGSPIAAAIMGSGQMAQLAASAGFGGAEMETVSPMVNVGGMTRSY